MSILIAILVFGVLIFVHELGHFLAARAFGVKVNEFAIGMGPTLISWKSKKYDTKYALRLLPIGGFVSMEGEDEESDDENAFNKKPKWKRAIILAAGSSTRMESETPKQLIKLIDKPVMIHSLLAFEKSNQYHSPRF